MTPTEASILTGLKRVINSAKVHVAATAVTGAWLTAKYAPVGNDPKANAVLWIAFMATTYGLAREVINGWAKEDVAAKSQPAPSVQVNTGDSSENTQANVPAAIPPSDPPSAPPASVAVPKTPVKPSGGATAVTASTNPTYHVTQGLPKGK